MKVASFVTIRIINNNIFPLAKAIFILFFNALLLKGAMQVQEEFILTCKPLLFAPCLMHQAPHRARS